jgi:hypothetical protein
MPATTDADGVYTVEVPEDLRCLERVAIRVLLSKQPRAISYCSIDPHGGPALRLTEPSVLPFTTPAIELPPRGDDDEVRTVVLDGGLALEVKPSLYRGSTGRYEEFSGRRIPTDSVGLCGEATTFEGLYAFSPEHRVEAPGYALRIPNETGLAAGTRVELFVLGGLDCKLYGATSQLEEVEWGKFGEAEVSSDGTTLVADEGSGLPCFTWLGYRVKE